ncbi:MAG: response regulator [Betaproteobacteria bacterium]|jgi:twitching motility two-component system response regulator PilH|nr:response regulator [Rhodocyclaceae bacterium]MCE2723834.1 response regulator [Betaproteobacteria bacterium]
MTTLKCLVVEDTKTDRELIGRQLATLGHIAVFASDGSEAVSAALEHKPDIIFLDIVMKDVSGYEALELLSEENGTKDIPVVIVSTKELPSDIEYAKELGASDYIVKPLTADVLKATLAKFEAVAA